MYRSAGTGFVTRARTKKLHTVASETAAPTKGTMMGMMGEIHAAMTERGEIATYERYVAEIAAITAKIEALRAVPSANEVESEIKRTDMRDLARTRRALKTRAERMFDTYAGRVARAPKLHENCPAITSADRDGANRVIRELRQAYEDLGIDDGADAENFILTLYALLDNPTLDARAAVRSVWGME